MLDQFDPQEKLDTQMQPKEEKDRKEGRSLFRWLIYGLLGLGGISLIATFVVALSNPCDSFNNIEPKNNVSKPSDNFKSKDILY